MTQQSPSTKLESTWGKFSTKQAAEATQIKLKEAGISPEKIILETEDFHAPVKLEDTEALANLKVGAIAGVVLGFLVGLSLSLIVTNFSGMGLAAFNNWQTIHYLAPFMGAIVGAVGMGLISGISGASFSKSKSNVNSDRSAKSKRYLVVVKGTATEVNTAREIINQQDGVVEEADRR